MIWTPQEGPQRAFLECPISEIFFGGSRYGGKTDGLLGHFLKHEAEERRNATGLLCRPTQKELIDVINRAKELTEPMGWTYKGRPEHILYAPSGATVMFFGLEDEAALEKVQGWSLSWIAFEEMPKWRDINALLKLYACLRGPAKRKWFLGNGNPGGVSHHSIKERYIDNGPYTPYRDPDTGIMRVYIPATYRDNKIGMGQNPDYVNQLRASGGGSEALIRAWLDGDWEAPVGQFFTEWDESVHVIEPFHIPKHITIFRSMDWGTSKPFSIGWWAVWDGSTTKKGLTFPRGSLIRVKEWYGSKGRGQGLKMTATAVAKGVIEREEAFEQEVMGGPSDTDLWAFRGGENAAEMMAKEGIHWVFANKQERIQGWQQVRQKLIGTGVAPEMYFFNTCSTARKYLPAATHDVNHFEDTPKKDNIEDHLIDEVRYAVMYRKLVRGAPKKKRKPPPLQMNVLMKEARARGKPSNRIRIRY